MRLFNFSLNKNLEVVAKWHNSYSHNTSHTTPIGIDPKGVSSAGASVRYVYLQYIFTLVEGLDHAAGVGYVVDLLEWLIPLPAL